MADLGIRFGCIRKSVVLWIIYRHVVFLLDRLHGLIQRHWSAYRSILLGSVLYTLYGSIAGYVIYDSARRKAFSLGKGLDPVAMMTIATIVGCMQGALDV